MIRPLSLALVLSLTGCPGNEPPPFVPMSDGSVDVNLPDGVIFDGGAPDTSGDAAIPEACGDDGPSVTLVAPIPAAGATDENVLIGPRHTVSCDVVRPASGDSRPVNPDSVSISLVAADGSAIATPVVSSEGMTFSASFDLSEQNNGTVRFRCVAEDTEARCGDDTLETLLDLGPRVEITSPAPDSVHASSMDLRYTLTEAPITGDDSAATIASHTLVVAGVTIVDTVDEGDGSFSAAIDFSDDTVFEEELSGDFEIQIEAANSRTPIPATRVVRQPFTLDRTPPTIEFVAPEEGELIGGRVRVAVEVNDPSGVDESTLILRAGMTELPLRSTDIASTYEVFFDAASFPSTVTELTLNVSASDNAANRQTASRIVKLDSTPPIASLDPPLVREGRMRGGNLECSRLFDPVGEDSVNDGQVVGTAAEFRVRTQDEGNQAFGSTGTVTFLAGLESVQLYLHDETDVPLIVDTTGDGVCDSINPDVEPVPGDPSTAVVVDLEPIRATGTWPFNEQVVSVIGTPVGAYTVDGGTIYDACVAGAVNTTIPRMLCEESTPMVRVIESTYAEPTIYAKPIINTLTCVGDAFDFQGSLDEGWSCAVIRSEDRLGNVGISRPLRTCFVDGVGDDPCPGAPGTIAPEAMRPNCAVGCTLPRSFVDAPSYQLFIDP